MKKYIQFLTICAILIFAAGNAWTQQNAGRVAHPFTKNSMPSTVTTVKLAKSLSLSMTAAVSSLVNVDDVLIAGADYLGKMQADITEDIAGNGHPDVPDDPDDGGWDWRSTVFTHSTSTSRKNLYGATAQGLYYAYLETGDATYMTAMLDAATYMIGDAGIRSAADLIFLMKFQELPGVTSDIYQDGARAKYDGRVTQYGSATGFAEYIRDLRASQGYENGIIPWDIGAWTVAAQMLYDRFGGTYDLDADNMAEVLYQDSYQRKPFGYFDLTTDKNNGWDPTWTNKDYWWYSLGISGLIDAFESANVHTAEIPGLVALLLDCQYPGGGFSGSYGANANDEDWQGTAYAVKSLARVDQATYQDNINRACFWIGSTQDASSGGWVYGSGNHYPEVGGENTAALYFRENPSEVWVDDNYSDGEANDGHLWGYDAFDNIQDGIDAVGESTVNVAAGTYTENIVIDKPLTLIGAGSGNTILDAVGTPADYGILLTSGGTSATQRLTIEGMTIKNSSSHGIKAYKGGGLDLGFVTFKDLLVTRNGSRGVEIHNNVIVHDLEISDCRFISNGAQGLRTASNVIVNGMHISDSEFNLNSYGLYLQGTINNVSLLNSTFNNSVGGYGGYMTETGALTNLNIEDCEFNDNIVGLMIWNVQDNSDITIKGSSFRDNDKWGTLIWGNTLTNVLVEECDVMDNDGIGTGYYGIDFYTYSGVMNSVAAQDNNITGHAAGGGIKNRNIELTAVVDGTCNWWGAADGPSGLGRGSGDGVSDNVTFAPWLLSDGSCLGGTLLAEKIGVRDYLAALAPSGDKKTDDRIENAIKHIDHSLGSDLWEDPFHLTQKGKKVFDEEKKAVKELKKIVKQKKNNLLKTEAQEAIDRLVAIDEALAQIAIDDAVAAGGKAKEIEKAIKEMGKAIEELAKGHSDHAIDKYKKAWERALKAV